MQSNKPAQNDYNFKAIFLVSALKENVPSIEKLRSQGIEVRVDQTEKYACACFRSTTELSNFRALFEKLGVDTCSG